MTLRVSGRSGRRYETRGPAAFGRRGRDISVNGHLFWVTGSIMMTILLLLAGLVCFALFFKAIDFFDKI
jgi:hypothetical protein